MIGADAIIKCLEAEGVSTVFGYPGVAICPFFNSILDSDIKTVLIRTEQNAAHAASGVARMTGRPGVCAVTSGPGATNVITGIATAFADSIPMICITGQVNSELLGSDVFQEADITGAVESFVKYSYLVKNVNDIPRVFKEAFYIANTGRKGPVLIDIPIDIQNATIKNFHYPEEVNLRTYKPTVKGHAVQIKKVIKELERAKRPIICAGGGVLLSEAEEELRSFAEEHGIPVVSTMMGIGVMPNDDDLYMGMLGTNGKPHANYAVHECDVLVLVGARVADRAVVKPYKLERRNTTIVHIDVDPAEIGKNLGTTVPLVGDVHVIFENLLQYEIPGDYTAWNEELAEKKAAYVDRRHFNPDFVNPCRFVQTLSSKMNDDAIYVADVGQNQLWSADNYVMKHGRFLTTGGFGTMGYSIPAAIGVRAALPDTQIVAVCGDGSFQMSLMELATMRQWNLPIKFVIMRNGYLGLVREYQHHTYHDRYSGVSLDGSPDFEKIADAYGLDYFHLEHNDEMEQRIDEFLACEHAAMMVCEVYSFDLVKE